MNQYFNLFIISILISYLFLKLIYPNLIIYAIDKPNSRSSHIKETPTCGGISIVFTSVILGCLQNFWVPLICLPLAIVGLIDDTKQLSPKFRLLAQIITTVLLIITSNNQFRIIENMNYVYLPIYLIIISTLTIYIINAFNFIDGVDGLLGSCSNIIFISIAILCKPELIVIAGSILGFLFLNWNPAKIFMGDVGSTYLGAVFAGTLLDCAYNFELFVSLMLLGLPIFIDTTSCILKRLYYKQNISKPHKLHLFQRLNRFGWSHGKVSLTYLSLHIILSVGLLLGGLRLTIFLAFIVFFIFFMLEKNYAVSFKKAFKLDYGHEK